MLNSLDPEKDRHSVGPDLGSNYLQRLSADEKLLIAKRELNSSFIIFIAVVLLVNYAFQHGLAI